MSTIITHIGLPVNLSRHHFSNLIVRIRQELGLSKTAVNLLSHYIKERTFDSDYLPHKICAVWPKVKDVAYILGLSVKSVNNAERELEDKGFIIRTTSGNGFREGKRSHDEDKSIEWAHGVNLAPLIAKAKNIIQIAEGQDRERQSIEKICSEIRHTNKLIRKTSNLKTLEESQSILPNGRTARIQCLERLKNILTKLKALLFPKLTKPRPSKTSDASEEKDVPIYKTILNNKFSTYRPVIKKPNLQITPHMVGELSDQQIKDHLSHLGEPNWDNIIETAYQFSPTLGISQNSWGKACQMLGRQIAAVCLIITHKNHNLPLDHRFKVRNPAACFTGILRSVQNSTCNLNGLIGAALQHGKRKNSYV